MREASLSWALLRDNLMPTLKRVAPEEETRYQVTHISLMQVLNNFETLLS